jgi:hypothetical protein
LGVDQVDAPDLTVAVEDVVVLVLPLAGDADTLGTLDACRATLPAHLRGQTLSEWMMPVPRAATRLLGPLHASGDHSELLLSGRTCRRRHSAHCWALRENSVGNLVTADSMVQSDRLSWLSRLNLL